MTVNVVRKGLENIETFECECKQCGSVLEVTDVQDLVLGTFGGDRESIGDLMIYVKCPVCDCDVLAPEKQQKLYTQKLHAIRKT